MTEPSRNVTPAFSIDSPIRIARCGDIALASRYTPRKEEAKPWFDTSSAASGGHMLTITAQVLLNSLKIMSIQKVKLCSSFVCLPASSFRHPVDDMPRVLCRLSKEYSHFSWMQKPYFHFCHRPRPILVRVFPNPMAAFLTRNGSQKFTSASLLPPLPAFARSLFRRL